MLCLYTAETSNALRRIPIKFVASSDGLTPVVGWAGVSGQIMLSKNGATPVTAAHTPVSIGRGAFYYECSSTEHNTPGFLLIEASCTDARPFSGLVEIRPINWSASANLGMSNMPTTVAGGTDLWSVSIGDSYPVGTAGWLVGNSNRFIYKGYVCAGVGLNSFVLPSDANPNNAFYNDQMYFFVSGTGAGQAGIIDGYTGASRLVSTATSLITGVTAGTEVILFPMGLRGLSKQELVSAVWEASIIPSPTSTAGWYMHRLDTSVGTRHTAGATVAAVTSVLQTSGYTVSLAASAFTSAALAIDGMQRLTAHTALSVWNYTGGRSVVSVTEKTGFTVSIAASAIGNAQFNVSTFTQSLFNTSAFRDIHFEASLANRLADHFLRRNLASARAGSWGDTVDKRSALGGFSKLVNRVRVNAGVSLEVYAENDSTLFYTQTVNTSVSAVPIIEVDTVG